MVSFSAAGLFVTIACTAIPEGFPPRVGCPTFSTVTGRGDWPDDVRVVDRLDGDHVAGRFRGRSAGAGRRLRNKNDDRVNRLRTERSHPPQSLYVPSADRPTATVRVVPA